MPELAEVFYYAQRWFPALGQKFTAIELHPCARVFRGTETTELQRVLTGQALQEIETHGKQMYFLFTGQNRLGIHLGMTGELTIESANFQPKKSDHLVLRQPSQSLVFRDPRMFGRVRFASGPKLPEWWSQRPTEILSPEFSRELLQTVLARRTRLPLKALLLRQEIFPGVGNWMADEILWRSKLAPKTPAGKLNQLETKKLWQETRWVARHAMRLISQTLADPPATWLFPHRWRDGGHCPRCQSPLQREQVGGRTTCWCSVCQN